MYIYIYIYIRERGIPKGLTETPWARWGKGGPGRRRGGGGSCRRRRSALSRRFLSQWEKMNRTWEETWWAVDPCGAGLKVFSWRGVQTGTCSPRAGYQISVCARCTFLAAP